MDDGLGPEPDHARDLETERQRRRQQSREKYRMADPERARLQHLQSQRRSRDRLKAEVDRRARDRQRVRAWTAAHPERAKARTRNWNEQNPERVREYKRNYYRRNQQERQRATRDQNQRRREDPAQRAKEQQYRNDHREDRNAAQRARRADPEARAKHNSEQNERRRRDRRHRRLGLPPRPLRRSTINERAHNAAAAAAFFTTRRSPGDLQRLREELAEVRAEARPTSETVWQADLAARVRADAQRPARIAALLDRYLATPAGARLREEVRMDSIARQLRGAGPYPDLTGEMRRRAAAALIARRAALTSRSQLPAEALRVDAASLHVSVDARSRAASASIGR